MLVQDTTLHANPAAKGQEGATTANTDGTVRVPTARLPVSVRISSTLCLAFAVLLSLGTIISLASSIRDSSSIALGLILPAFAAAFWIAAWGLRRLRRSGALTGAAASVALAAGLHVSRYDVLSQGVLAADAFVAVSCALSWWHLRARAPVPRPAQEGRTTGDA